MGKGKEKTKRSSSVWQDKEVQPFKRGFQDLIRIDHPFAYIPSSKAFSPCVTRYQRPRRRGHRGYIETLSLSFPQLSLTCLPVTAFVQDYIVSLTDLLTPSQSTRPLERLPLHKLFHFLSQLGSLRLSTTHSPHVEEGSDGSMVLRLSGAGTRVEMKTFFCSIGVTRRVFACRSFSRSLLTSQC